MTEATRKFNQMVATKSKRAKWGEWHLDEELKEEVKKTLPKGVKSVFFSSVAQQGLKDLKDLIWNQLNVR